VCLGSRSGDRRRGGRSSDHWADFIRTLHVEPQVEQGTAKGGNALDQNGPHFARLQLHGSGRGRLFGRLHQERNAAHHPRGLRLSRRPSSLGAHCGRDGAEPLRGRSEFHFAFTNAFLL
jgi:hypothetical protein